MVAAREISSGKPPCSVLYERSYNKYPKRVTCECRAQLFWLSSEEEEQY
jgi:hypothetical protein